MPPRIAKLAGLGAFGACAGIAALYLLVLFGTRPNDPGTMAVAAAILLGATLTAGYGPARRASRVDPIAALRHD